MSDLHKFLHKASLEDVESNYREPPEPCSVCGEPMRRRDLYCSRCGPPENPDEIPDDGLTGWQTLNRITLIVVLFLSLVFNKLDVKLDFLDKIFGVFSVFDEAVEAPVSRPADSNLKVFLVVNVFQANVRKEPSLESTVIAIAEKNTEVRVIDRKGDWARILIRDKNGWIASQFLTAKAK